MISGGVDAGVALRELAHRTGLQPVGAENAIRLPDLRVFMYEPTEHVVASNASGGRWPGGRR
jgi:hypothetical protein